MSRRRQTTSRTETKPKAGYKPVKLVARSENQKEFIKSVAGNEITLASGPAGCGKSHIAAGLAVQAMKTGIVDRIVVCRPVVGVGQDIGY